MLFVDCDRVSLSGNGAEQEVAKARAEALDATATKEGQGVAVKEVGHLLEALRKSVVLTATGKARCSQEGGLNADPSSALDQPRDGTAVLARAMVRRQDRKTA